MLIQTVRTTSADPKPITATGEQNTVVTAIIPKGMIAGMGNVTDLDRHAKTRRSVRIARTAVDFALVGPRLS
jgi:hypothetical protein